MGSRVALGMSGGVDSSVAAFLLAERGYEVIGVTLKLLPDEIERACAGGAAHRICCSSEAVEEARRAALSAGIPHYVFDGRDRFRAAVIDPFVDDYFAGRTPNPCTACNPAVKFALLLEAADAAEAPLVATGHYARLSACEGAPCVRRGVDPAKDQSYMLAMLSPAQVARLSLPLGEFTKQESRAKASALGLAVADKPDSQDICFVPDNDYRAFLRKVAPQRVKAGRIVDAAGRELGRHDGHVFFTPGQRKGLGLAHPTPLYVLRVEPDGTVVVGEDRETFAREMRVRLVARHAAFAGEGEYAVQIRARHPAEPAEVAPDGPGLLRVTFRLPTRAITPGQTAAFYRGDLLLAGGVIEPFGADPPRAAADHG